MEIELTDNSNIGKPKDVEHTLIDIVERCNSFENKPCSELPLN